MNPYKYVVSLRIRHPSLDAETICNELGLKPSYKWSVGNKRVTQKGDNLDGHYTETYCSFKLPPKDIETVSEYLSEANDALRGKRDFFHKLIASGGQVEYFVGWFFTGNSGDLFDHTLLKDLAKLGISLSLDVYPDGEGWGGQILSGKGQGPFKDGGGGQSLF